MKKLFSAADLPQTPYIAMLRSEWRSDSKRATKKIEATLKYPIFVKPANLGSSVGISKVHDRSELAAAMDLAASFDRKLVIEQGVGGPGAKPRELEVAVLGSKRRRRDRPRSRVLRLRSEIPERRKRSHHPGKAHRSRV
jgi:D-alanine-D-alanine ligase